MFHVNECSGEMAVVLSTSTIIASLKTALHALKIVSQIILELGSSCIQSPAVTTSYKFESKII